jgi:hypothetical protein
MNERRLEKLFKPRSSSFLMGRTPYSFLKLDVGRSSGWSTSWRDSFHFPQTFLNPCPENQCKTVTFVSWSIAWRLYAMLIAYALTVDIVIINYGELRNSKWMTKHPFWRKVLATVLLPRISKWHVLLKNVSHRKSVDIRVDVITKRDVLYRGTVEDLMLEPNGALSGLLLTKPFRYQREKYLEDLKRHAQGGKTEPKPHAENYWKAIPGHAFLVMSDQIETINLRTYDDKELENRLKEILKVRFSTVRRNAPSTENPSADVNEIPRPTSR